MTNKLVLINDLVGRTIIGELNTTSEHAGADTLVLDNPAIVHIQPVRGGQPGQLQVQVLPFIIQEFIAAAKRKDKISWVFSRHSVAVPVNLELDPNLATQYARLFSSLILPPASDTPIVNLFDDKK